MAHTLASLRRWGVTDKELPPVDQIKNIHVYDFDNTLFASPLPNAKLWSGPTCGLLQQQTTFINGGWWHDSSILASTGRGVEEEEKTAWEGWWNPQIVNLVELTMEQKDAVNVLLTGRSEKGFAELVQRILHSKRLQFDLVCLKPMVGPANQKFASTGKFKLAFLEELMRTYHGAGEIRIYEDREKHVQMFREFFNDFNTAALADQRPEPRKPIRAEVIEVVENATTLDPVAEVAEVQRMINIHNEAVDSGALPAGSKTFEITRSVFYTGYLVSPSDTDKLLAAGNILSLKTADKLVRTLGNNIMITPRPPTKQVLDKVGGLGKRMNWRVVAVGSLNNEVWAARVEPVNPGENFYIASPVPLVVLACRGRGRPVDASHIKSWQPLPEGKQFEIETVVGEKVQLKIEEIRRRQSNVEDKGFKRMQTFDDEEDFPALNAAQPSKPPFFGPKFTQQTRSYNTNENHRPNASAYARAGGGRQQSGRGGSHSHGRGGSGGGSVGGRSGGGAGTNASPASGGRGGSHRGAGQQSFRGRGRGGPGGAYRSLDDQSRRSGQHDAPGGNSGLTY